MGVAEAALDDNGESLGVFALLHRAEVAMYQAKADRRGIRRYSDDLERSSLSRLTLASELADAIDHGELRLDYQPKIDAVTKMVTGVEALVRWHHPTRGLLVPDAFIPLAEQTGMIRELTSWVLEKALSECAGWHREGHFIPVAVNLSAATVHDPELMGAVKTALSQLGTAPGLSRAGDNRICCHVRPRRGAFESQVARRLWRAALARRLRHRLLLALLLTALACHRGQDRQVLRRALLNDETARAIVASVVELAHGLHLSVIAEGVDSAAVAERLTEIGCDALQGFYVASPMSPAEPRAGSGQTPPSRPIARSRTTFGRPRFSCSDSWPATTGAASSRRPVK